MRLREEVSRKLFNGSKEEWDALPELHRLVWLTSAKQAIAIVLERAAEVADARREMAERHRARAEAEGSSRGTISDMRAMATASEHIADRIRALAEQGEG